MFFTTSRDNLIAAINAAQKAINPKSIIPLYSHVKIEAMGNLAVFTGVGVDVAIECSVPVQSERDGLLLVHARLFSDIVRRLPDMPIIIEQTGPSVLEIRYEHSLFSLQCTSPNEFPAMPASQGGYAFQVSADTLRNLIRQTAFAASTDEARNIYTGILWEAVGNELSLVSTDTHRLAWAKGSIIQENTEEQSKFIIPSKICAEIARLVQDGNCLIQVINKTVHFTFDNIHMSCQTLNGTFPDFRQAIPGRFITTVQVNSKIFRDVIDRVSLFTASSETSSTINLTLSNSAISLHSRSEFGSGREEVAVDIEGDELHIAFNARYLSDYFKATDDEEVCIQFSGQLSAGVMKHKEEDNFIYLILPVKV